MSEQSEPRTLPEMVEQLKAGLGKLVGSNITVAIVDANAEIKYIDKAISKFSDFIVSFTKGNFALLSVGDHSLPLSGTNIAFFKISEKSLVILNSDKGPVGQLLAFKGRMRKYTEQLDLLLEAVPEEEEEAAIPAKAAVRVPMLTVSIANKKFGMEEAKVLHLVNGENNITDICEKTKLPQLKVDEILRRYQKKGWIKLKRLIVGLPTAGKEEEPGIIAEQKPVEQKPVEQKLEPETVAPAPKLAPEPRQESIYLFPILEGEFDASKFPKSDASILQLCDGQHTINDIVKETALSKLQVMEIIKKYEKKGKVSLTKILPPAEQLARGQPTEVPNIPEILASPEPTPLAPTPPTDSEEVVFDELMDIMNETQPLQETSSEMPPQITPEYTPIPPQPVVPPKSTPKFTPPPRIEPKKFSRSTPTIPPSSVSISTPPPVTQPPAPTKMVELEGEPVSDAVFDDLQNLLKDTAPIAPSPQAPATPAPPSPVEVPAIPIPPPPPQTGDLEPEEIVISSNSLLEPAEEGIKITTYPEEDPLKSRLERLSNILEETTKDVPKIEETQSVKVVGSKAVCPKCKTYVMMMSKICPNCQTPLRTCPNCKAPITLFARICPSCGSLL